MNFLLESRQLKKRGLGFPTFSVYLVNIQFWEPSAFWQFRTFLIFSHHLLAFSAAQRWKMVLWATDQYHNIHYYHNMHQVERLRRLTSGHSIA